MLQAWLRKVPRVSIAASIVEDMLCRAGSYNGGKHEPIVRTKANGQLGAHVEAKDSGDDGYTGKSPGQTHHQRPAALVIRVDGHG